jgi:hypothetical protein
VSANAKKNRGCGSWIFDDKMLKMKIKTLKSGRRNRKMNGKKTVEKRKEL